MTKKTPLFLGVLGAFPSEFTPPLTMHFSLPPPQLHRLLPLAPPLSPNSIPPPPQLSPIQRIAGAALDVVEKSVLQKLEHTQTQDPAVDPTVQLAGNFAPVQECPVRHDLQVVGTIPTCVQGVYLRNGGNPLFPPLAGHHLFDGDGMIHAVSLGAGNRASYACRFTRTNRLVTEAGLGRPVFLKPIGELRGLIGLARFGLFSARASIGLVDVSKGAGTANAGLVYFDGRILAMSEDDLPYVVHVTDDGDLETIQRWDFNGQLKEKSLIAHPKVDPNTGDLYTLRYEVLDKPYLKFFKFNARGNKVTEVDISLNCPTMVHDFAVSESHVIIPDHQIVFKLSEMINGRSPMVYDPSKVTRFGVLPKDATNESTLQWIDVPNCFCFHMYNAWEEFDEHGDKIIVVLTSCMSPPVSIFTSGGKVKSELSEIRLNLRQGKSTQRFIVSGMNLEAGQVDKWLQGKKPRHVYLAIADPWPKCCGIARVDVQEGGVTKFLYGEQRYGGEPCFVAAKAEEEDEEEGYVMSFVRDEVMKTSELVILKASTMEQVGLIELPTRVPYGFHGIFVTSQEVKKQLFPY